MDSDLDDNTGEFEEPLNQSSFKDLLNDGVDNGSRISNDAAREKTALLEEIFPSKPAQEKSQPRKKVKVVAKANNLDPVRRSGRILSIQCNSNTNCAIETDPKRSVCRQESSSRSSIQPTETAASTSTPGYVLRHNNSNVLVSSMYNSGTESDEFNGVQESTYMSQSFRTPPRRNSPVCESSSRDISFASDGPLSPNFMLQDDSPSPNLFLNNVSLAPNLTSHVNPMMDQTSSTLMFNDGDDDTSNKENVSPTVAPKKRRKAKKIVNKFGERITEHNAMPNFGEALHSQLMEGIIDREALNKAVKFHLRKTKKKELYLSSNEWHLVCSKLITKYPVLADVDSPESYTDLKYKLQNSITSERSYKNNGIPSRNKPPTGLQIDELPSGPSEITAAELLELQKQSANNERVRELIRTTLHEHREELKYGPTVLLNKYPHYKNADMLLYEYSLIVDSDLINLKERANRLLDRLYALDEALLPIASVESKLTTIRSVQRELLPKRLKNNKNIKLAIECKDAAEVYGDVEALSTGHPEQAPFLVVVVDSNQQGLRVITKALLLYKSGIISQYDNPMASDLLLYLLAAYFILDLQYPLAYNSFLRVIEKEIQGELSFGTSQTRPKQEYNHFMRNRLHAK